MRTPIPKFTQEAVIKEVDYKTGTCVVSTLTTSTSGDILDIPLPHFAGTGNSGIWMGIFRPGTKVIITKTSGSGTEFTVITGVVPQENKQEDYFYNQELVDVPNNTYAYPEIIDGRMVLRGDNGSELYLGELGDIKLISGNGGLYIKKYGLQNIISYNISHDMFNFSNAGRTYNGVIKRIPGVIRNFFPKTSLNEAPLFSDLNFHKSAVPVAFFNGSIPLKYSYFNKKRNPEISEHRMVFNEFATDSLFTGFDDEVFRIKNEKPLFENSESLSRYREPSNLLQLSEHELAEFVAGNLVDIKGNVLDINYRSLIYGDPGNKTPKNNVEELMESARRISRRGIGLHFLLSTNTVSNQRSTTQNTFFFDIDKEGFFKLNVPSTTDTGNIPFSSNINFSDEKNNTRVGFGNPTKVEKIPVHLRDEDGNPILPITNKTERETGIRYADSNKSPYFPSTDSSGIVRVNSTKYHNMYAIAERLIACNISKINIPETFVNDEGLIEGNSYNKPFEIFDSDQKIVEGTDLSATNPVTFMSTVNVFPAPPVIYSGGDTVVGGVELSDDQTAPPYSNSFVLEKDETGSFTPKIIDTAFGDPRAKIGGKSAAMNFEGSIETSIGSDHTDKKSIVLDTAGSMLAWLGKDANGRSLVLQSDGEVLVNIGGTYTDSVENPKMNVGKFVLRVNVSDKKHMDFENTDPDGKETDSDFIISIGEEGLVIAGMKKNAPMIIRNDGKILIESSTDLVLKANKIEQVSAKGQSTTPSASERG